MCFKRGETCNHTSQRADWIVPIALPAFEIFVLLCLLWRDMCPISVKDRKLVYDDDLHLPPPNAAPCKVHSPHIWAEDWPGSGNLSQNEGCGTPILWDSRIMGLPYYGTPILWDSSSVAGSSGYRLRLESPHSSSHTFSFFSAFACDACWVMGDLHNQPRLVHVVQACHLHHMVHCRYVLYILLVYLCYNGSKCRVKHCETSLWSTIQ